MTKNLAFIASTLLFAACGAADDETAGCALDDGCQDETPSEILSSKVAAESLTMDRVASADGAIRTDGRNDAAFDVTLAGPLLSLSLIVTDADGKPTGNQIWDTTVGDLAVPGDIGVTFKRGAQTWQVGVYEGDTLLNRADGSLPELAGTHHLRLFAANSGYFKAGVSFRWVLQRPDGTLARGPVFAYPQQ